MKTIIKLCILSILIFSSCTSINNKTDAIQNLNDEFDNPSTLKNWKYFHETENWPNRIKEIEIIKKGELKIIPEFCGLVNDKQGVYLYKEIKGNFIIEGRVKVTGLKQEVPENSWNLAGIMVRLAKTTTSNNCLSKKENWIYMMTGKSNKEKIIIDSKKNIDGRSRYTWKEVPKGWIELKIIRIKDVFITAFKAKNTNWIIKDIYINSNMKGPLQAGLNVTAVTSNYNLIPALEFNNRTTFDTEETPDTLALFDYIKFSEVPKLLVKNINSKKKKSSIRKFINESGLLK